MSNEDEIKAVVKAAVAKFGKLDILVNNAGITRDQLVMRMKRPDWNAVLDTNLTGPYLCPVASMAITFILLRFWPLNPDLLDSHPYGG